MLWLHGVLAPVPAFALQCLYVPRHSASSFSVLQPKTRISHSELMGHCEHKSVSGYFVPKFFRREARLYTHLNV